jgi:hypothetical protein
VGARVAVHAVAFHLAVWARVTVLAVVLHPAVRAGVAVRALVLPLAVTASLPPHGLRRSTPSRARLCHALARTLRKRNKRKGRRGFSAPPRKTQLFGVRRTGDTRGEAPRRGCCRKNIFKLLSQDTSAYSTARTRTTRYASADDSRARGHGRARRWRVLPGLGVRPPRRGRRFVDAESVHRQSGRPRELRADRRGGH